jgi:hypothetical protein
MTSLPLTWEPVGLEGLLPLLDATIEVGPLGEDRTQLATSARYRPPLGVVGRAITDQATTDTEIQAVTHEGGVEAHAP